MPRVFYTEEEVQEMLNPMGGYANQGRGLGEPLSGAGVIGKASAEKRSTADCCPTARPPELSYVLAELEEQASKLRGATEELVNRLGPVLDLGPKAEQSANEVSPGTTTVLGGRIADVTQNLRQLQRLVCAASSALEL